STVSGLRVARSSHPARILTPCVPTDPSVVRGSRSKIFCATSPCPCGPFRTLHRPQTCFLGKPPEGSQRFAPSVGEKSRVEMPAHCYGDAARIRFILANPGHRKSDAAHHRRVTKCPSRARFGSTPCLLFDRFVALPSRSPGFGALVHSAATKT